MNRWLYIYRWIMWNLLTHPFIHIYLKPSFRFFKTKESDSFPKPPFIVVCNHGTFFDPWIIGLYSHYPFGFMTNDDGFRGKGISQWYLKSIGAYPKKKGASDFKAMKKTMDLMRSNYPVCIFPEGQTTWDGETQLMYPGIEKIIRKTGVSVVTIRIQGNFLSKPWWALTKRKGRVAVTIKVTDKADVAKLSTEEIFALLKNGIYQNDIKDPWNKTQKFSGTQLACGLERFVWICTECGAEDQLTTNDNRITCSACGKIWEIDAYCQLTSETPYRPEIKDLKDWSEMHKSILRDKCTGGKPFTTATNAVALTCENEQGKFETIHGNGVLELNQNELRYITSGQRVSWSLKEITDYVVQKKDLFEFGISGKTYRVEFRGHSPMKWVMYLRYLNNYAECEKNGHL